MPKKIVVKVTWSTRKPLQMASFAKDTALDMTGNPVTPTPPVIPADVKAAADLVIINYANRKNGALAKTNSDDAITALDLVLHQNSDYVSTESAGDSAKIESTGYMATVNSHSPAVRPGTPASPDLKPMGGGRVKSTVAKVLGAEEYTHIFYTDSASVITVTETQIVVSSATGGSFIFATGGLVEEASGLTAQTSVSTCVVAHNAAGNSNASAVVKSGVL